MSIRLSSRRSCKRRSTESSSSRRKMVLDVDLNAYPDGTPGPFNLGEPHALVNSTLLLPVQGTERQEGLANEPIDVEAIEDEVTLLSSLRGFPQARNQPRRNLPVTLELDEDVVVHTASSGSALEDPITILALNTYCKREKIPSKRAIINCEAYENLENGPNAKRKNVADIPEPQQLAPKEPTFNCTVCWGALVEATSTICGHIFCQKCIYAAIKAQKKCPTCRRGITVRSTHRVYLPSSN